MRAAVVHEPGATPVLEQFTDPQPGPGVSVGTLLAASLNPLDLVFVNGQFPVRPLHPPCVAGYEAVVRLADGTHWYAASAPSPYGALAELIPVPDSDRVPVPAGLDPALAAGWRPTRSRAGSPSTSSGPGWKTSAIPGSGSRPEHRANSWSRPDGRAARCPKPRTHRIHVMPSHLPARDHVAMDWARALYTIRVDGHLGALMLSAFPGMTPCQRDTHTVLTGWLDQSALYGVLAEMEALGLVLIEVRQTQAHGKSLESRDDLPARHGDPWRGQELADTHGRLGRAPRIQGETVTSPDTEATGAPEFPEYVPLPEVAKGAALNEHGYHVRQVERNLYAVTDNVYMSAFLTTPDGVVIFDAPPNIGHNIRRAVDEVTAANGLTNEVTHFVYSHHHEDHQGAASLFGGDIVRIGHEETRRLLLRDGDPNRPAPDVTFADTHTLEVGGERVELAWHGPNHSPDNIYIHFPDHDTLMLIDVVNAGWVPIYNLNLSDDVIGYTGAPAIALDYPWTHLISGHLGRVATREDVAVHQQYIADIEAGSREALASVNPGPIFQHYGENAWAAVGTYLDAVTEQAAAPVIAKYTGVLGGADIAVFTRTTTFAIMQSLRLDRGPSGPIHP